MSLRHNDGLDTPKPSGTPIILNGDGISMVPTPCRGSGHFEKSWAPGKVASDSDIKKSGDKVLPNDPHYDPLKHQPRSAAARNSTARTGNTTRKPGAIVIGDGKVRRTFTPSIGKVVNFTAGDGRVLHGRIQRWGPGGCFVLSHDGEYKVDWTEIRDGIYEAAEEPKA